MQGLSRPVLHRTKRTRLGLGFFSNMPLPLADRSGVLIQRASERDFFSKKNPYAYARIGIRVRGRVGPYTRVIRVGSSTSCNVLERICSPLCTLWYAPHDGSISV